MCFLYFILLHDDYNLDVDGFTCHIVSFYNYHSVALLYSDLCVICVWFVCFQGLFPTSYVFLKDSQVDVEG